MKRNGKEDEILRASETLGVNIFNLTGEARSISLTNRLNPPVASIDHLFIKKDYFDNVLKVIKLLCVSKVV